MTTAVAIERTPYLIANEINILKLQTRNIVAYNAIEIGRKLCEAKEQIPHGEWGKWLETSVDYKQSTANDLMRIFKEYGNVQMALFGETGPNSQALGNLSYTHLVSLMGVPAEEREEFLKENDVESMSTRELKQAIKERDQAQKERDEANKLAKEQEEEAERLLNEKEKAETELSDIKKKLEEAQSTGKAKEVKRLKQELEEADLQLKHANDEIEELNAKLKDKPIDVSATTVTEKLPEAVEQELEALRKAQQSTASAKFTVHLEALVKGFSSLLESLAVIEDPDEQEKYKGAVRKLIGKMEERL